MISRLFDAGARITSREPAVFSSRIASSWVRTPRATTGIFNWGGDLLGPARARYRLHILNVVHHEDPPEVRHELLGKLEPLGHEVGKEVRDARQASTRASHRGHEARRDRVIDLREHDRDTRSRHRGRPRLGLAGREDDIGIPIREIGGELRR